jgi:hypothetical protein
MNSSIYNQKIIPYRYIKIIPWIHPSIIWNSYPINRSKSYLEIHSIMWWNFLLLPYEKHTLNIHLFLWLKKGRGKFIPNSCPLNSYLNGWKFQFHALKVWISGPMGLTVGYVCQSWFVNIFQDRSPVMQFSGCPQLWLPTLLFWLIALIPQIA